MNRQKNELAVGIDLGTTYSAIAYVDDIGIPRTVRNRMGDLTTPSALCISDKELLFGREAVKESIRVPGMYADSFKRDMGATHFCRKVCGLDVPPQVLSGLLLEHMTHGCVIAAWRSPASCDFCAGVF